MGSQDPGTSSRSKDFLGGHRRRHQRRRSDVPDAGNGQTTVQLTLEYEPEGLVEKVGDKLNIVENQAERDLRNSRHSSSPRATPPVAGAGRSAKAPRSGPQGLSRPASPAGTAARPTARTQSQSGRTRKRWGVSPTQRDAPVSEHSIADGDPRLGRSARLIGFTGESSHLAGPAANFRGGGARPPDRAAQ
jgi:hypothetical protein